MCFNTASGKYCCNAASLRNGKRLVVVSIPQAVSTVATLLNGSLIIQMYVVSIPQAVSTVATTEIVSIVIIYNVSIPQAVSTVATKQYNFHYCPVVKVSIPQAVSTVATCK